MKNVLKYLPYLSYIATFFDALKNVHNGAAAHESFPLSVNGVKGSFSMVWTPDGEGGLPEGI